MNEEPTIRDIFYKLGALESKIDSALALQNNDRERLGKLEQRTLRLEQVEAKRTGMIAVLIGVFSILSTVIINFITNHLNFN